jgi:S1-C subfamily serine protease
MWLNLAAAQGNTEAAEERKTLGSGMAREQIAEAQRLSRAFVPRKQGEPPPADAPPRSSGTGFFITEDGYLITSHHVVYGASRLRVISPAGTKDARLLLSDAANDIALLKVDASYAALAIRPSRGVRMGDSVATVGFPNPGLQGFAPKFSKGEVSALTGVKDDPRVFQISVPLQPGNSGGALADSSGNVIGIIRSKLGLRAAVTTSGALPENVNYALKSSFLLAFLESVPGLVDRLKPPATAPKPVQQVAAELEKATVLVLAY